MPQAYTRVLVILATIGLLSSAVMMVAGLVMGSWFGALGFDLVVTFSLALASFINVSSEDEMASKLAEPEPAEDWTGKKAS